MRRHPGVAEPAYATACSTEAGYTYSVVKGVE